jgi:hypothetical protein
MWPPLQKLSSAGFGRGRAHIGLSARETDTGDLPPSPLPPAKSGRPVVARRARSCQGGSLVQGKLMGGGWVEGGSLRRAVDCGAGWRRNAGGEHGHRVSSDEDRTIEDHRA